MDSSDSTSQPHADAGKSNDGGSCQSGETCGGDCRACGIGAKCTLNSDCESKLCNGTCLPTGCSNGIRDVGETDIDCGGSCDPCEDGRRCEQDPHCQSRVCVDEVCQEPTCTDDRKNGNETDKDCGGHDCDACANGSDCDEDRDCSSGFCKSGACADPACGDGSKNGTETDLDCGGKDCNGCGTGRKCKVDGDCASLNCAADDQDVMRCVAAACTDRRTNGNETDKDCGGGCDGCDDGAHCEVGTDCSSLVCEAVNDELTCIPASCDDKRKNGNETGKDCGGDTDCSLCPAKEGCQVHQDCLTNSCVDEICQQPTCTDGRLNQSEVATDCGGDCEGCPTGTACTSADDCRSGHCAETCQKGGASTKCDGDDECLSGDCKQTGCAPGSTGDACYENVDCRSNNCGASGKCGPSGLAQQCETDADCVSGQCSVDTSKCQASQFRIQTDPGSTSDQQITFRVWVQRGDTDPTRAWKDFAMLYFFHPTVVSDFAARYYTGPDQQTRDNRFLAREVASGQWVMMWRATNNDSVVIPVTPMTSPIELQLHYNPPQNHDDQADFSYQSGTQADNQKVAICQRVDGRWIHTQGSSPDVAPNPCDLVIDTCPANSSDTCDVMQRLD